MNKYTMKITIKSYIHWYYFATWKSNIKKFYSIRNILPQSNWKQNSLSLCIHVVSQSMFPLLVCPEITQRQPKWCHLLFKNFGTPFKFHLYGIEKTCANFDALVIILTIIDLNTPAKCRTLAYQKYPSITPH